MRYFSLLLLLFSSLIVIAQTESKLIDFNNNYDQFLEKHLKNGRVDYKNISKETFASLIEFVRTFDTKDLDENTLKSFRINAYNLLVIEQVWTTIRPNPCKTFLVFSTSTKYKLKIEKCR